MSADWFTDFDPALLSLDPLLLQVRPGQPASGASFLRNVLAVLADHRGWPEAVREYVEALDFEHALRCLTRATEGQAELLREIRDGWFAWRRRSQSELDTLLAKHETLRGLQDPGPRSDGVAELLAEAGAILASITEQAFETPETALQLLDRTRLRISEFSDVLTLADIEIEDELRAIADREQRVRERLRSLKADVDRLMADLLLRDDLSPEYERAINSQQTRINDAIRARNVALVEQGLAGLHRLAVGTAEVDELLPPEVAIARSVPSLGLPVLLRRSDLSVAAQQLLKQPSLRVPDQAPGKEFSAFSPWEWDKTTLDRHKAMKIGEASAGTTPDAERALGELLFTEGKILLLAGDAFRARLLFSDAFRWSCQFSTEAARVQREAAVACILLASAIMFLPLGERPSLDTRTLATEVQRRIDTFLIGRLDQRELLYEQSAVLVNLDPGAASTYFQAYLLPYLSTHARAANDLLVGLVELVDEHASSALQTLCAALRALLGELSPSSEAQLDEALAASRSLGEDTRSGARGVVRRLRTALLTLIDDYDVAAVVHDALEALDDKLKSPSKPATSVRQSLTVSQISLGSEPRIIVRVTSPETTSIRYLRSALDFFDSQGQLVKLPFDEPPLMALLPQKESREIDFRLRLEREDPLVSRVKFVQVRHTQLDDKGAARRLEADHEKFAIQFRRLAVMRESPSTPYVVGAAIQNLAGIYGRDDDVDAIWTALTGDKQDNVVLLRGPRRIGKTTLLNALVEHRRFVDRYIIAREDLQVKDAVDSAVVFRAKIPSVVQARLKLAGLEPVAMREASADKSPEQAFKEFMLEVDEVVRRADRRLLIILDELDQLAENPVFGRTAVATLREVILATRRTSFVLAGAREILDRLTLTREDRLFKLALEVSLAPLPLLAARKLIQQPAESWYSMSDKAIDLIVRVTNRQPYLIQCVCHEVFRRATREGLGHVAENYVEDILLREIVPRERFFVEFKSIAQDDVDYRILKAMALRQWGNQYVSITELARDLGMGREEGRRGIQERLQTLASQAPEVIERHGVARQRYRLKVGLFARHLRFLQEDIRFNERLADRRDA
ncbi:MAG TPA: hypothetical protein VH165_05440 [Kofleriaceae bacterium]|jgi:hypothetical protein|nr:hypothetical protein [Kofleriaceae bacterium]